ncbi:MAG: hypothetical protein J3Q66DRAFT_404940 [Benniella sp.]|nr:MAG: hypothetical protein J3Q66DRAFT_404940 [Benniella sp.]
MPSLHPLELPEVLLSVASYVSERSLPDCVRVSKAWHQVFVPLLWKDIALQKSRPIMPQAIHSNSQFVKTLRICQSFAWERAAPVFPKLDSLTFEYSIPDEYVFDFTTRHPFLTYLGLVKTVLPLSSRLLDQLIGLYNLRHLGIRVLQADEDNADKVWQLCARLERLDLSYLVISTQGNLGSTEFPHLCELRGIDCDEDCLQLVLSFVERCPNLQSFDWTLCHSENQRFIPVFAQLIAAGTWPHLRSISARMFKHEDDLSRIVQSMRRITDFMTDELLFTPKLLGLLRPHFSHLQALNLTLASQA